MGLFSKAVSCRICAKTVSTSAEVCPHCGEKKFYVDKLPYYILAIIFIPMFFLMIVAATLN